MPRRSSATLLATVFALGAAGSLTAAQTPSTAAAPSAAQALRSKLPPSRRSFDPAVIASIGSVANTTPSPSPSASASPIDRPAPRCTIPDPHQPAAPDDFDASAIPWIGEEWGYHDPGANYYWGRSVWVGALDGSGQRAIVSPGLTAAHLMADGAVVVVRSTEDAWDLVVIGTDGSERLVASRIDDSTIAIDSAGRNVYAWHHGPDPYLTIGDVWGIPLDGSPPEVVLIDIGSPKELFVSPDGSTVAVGWSGGDDGPYWTVVRRGDRPQLRIKNAVPIGIDAGRRVLVIENEGITRVDPRSGRRSTFPLHGRYPEEASLTPSGRTLLMDWTDKAGRIASLSARDLRSGRTRTWRLPTDADWYLTDLGTDRYVVLGREKDLTTTEWAIADLESGRLGFIPFCPPAMATSPSPSVTP